jgi:hypothetical protein
VTFDEGGLIRGGLLKFDVKVKNSTNINKTNNYRSSQIIEHKKKMMMHCMQV